MKRTLFAAVLLAAALSLVSCTKTEEPLKRDFFAMDTLISLTIYGGDAAADRAESVIREIEDVASVTNPDSLVHKLNSGESVAPTAGLDEMLLIASEIRDVTGGAFNPMMYPVVAAWGFYDESYRIPTDTELEPLIALTQSYLIRENGEIALMAGAGIDLGALAKGYASDLAIAALRESGVTSAIISLGGNVFALGEKPDGSPWIVAVQDPFDPASFAGKLQLRDCAAVTSGVYQRFFERDGTIYHHLFDPETGKPAQSGFVSVTIVIDDCALGDALSTALFVMGKDRALDFWRGGKCDFEMILIESDGAMTVTSGLTGIFTSDLAFEVAEK